MTTKTEQVEAILDRRYPCQAIPHGALTEIGNEVGCSRELVRKVASLRGYDSLARPRLTVVGCAECGKEISRKNRSGLCNTCRWIELPCAHCGEPVRQLASHYVHRVGVQGRYTGRVFCNRKCYAAFRTPDGHEIADYDISPRPCPVCGESFTPRYMTLVSRTWQERRGHTFPPLTCSRSCSMRQRWALKANRNAPARG